MPFQNPLKPNLLREIYPYDKIPKIILEDKTVPLNLPEHYWVTDTTLRDGQQSRPPYTIKQIVQIFQFLHQLGGPQGVIRQTEFFLYTEKDREAVRKCQELNYQFPQITAWIRATEEDLKLVKETGIKEAGILTSVSDYHIYLKLKWDRQKALDHYLSITKEALEAGILPRCHFEDITRADIFGFVLPYAQKLMELSLEVKIPIKIRLCDTLGYGLSFPQSSLPRSVPKLVSLLHKEAGLPQEQLEWHGHNDFHQGLINGFTAWLYGSSAVNGTLFGIGERTGNSPIEALCILYAALKGSDQGIDFPLITEIASYFNNELNIKIASNYPLVGAHFNTTAAGIHADGLTKNEEIYNIFNTTKILNRPPQVIVTDKSGLAGIAFWLNQYLNLPEEKRIDKKDPRVLKIKEWVDQEYEKGRTTNITNEEMAEKARGLF